MTINVAHEDKEQPCRPFSNDMLLWSGNEALSCRTCIYYDKTVLPGGITWSGLCRRFTRDGETTFVMSGTLCTMYTKSMVRYSMG